MTAAESEVTFLSLPFEIRETIYHLAVNCPPTFNPYDRNPPLDSLLLASRQIYSEYSKIYYGSHIFHLHIRRRGPGDHSRPDTSGLAEWRSLSSHMLGCIREVMIHFDIFFRSKVPRLDVVMPRNVCWLAAGLSMAPNIEILHIVLFCTRGSFNNMKFTHADNIQKCVNDTVIDSVLQVIPWLKDCCKASTLPNLMRLVLHVDTKYGNQTMDRFMDKVEGYRWVQSLSRSYVSCENEAYCETMNLPFIEHTFSVVDERWRSWSGKKMPRYTKTGAMVVSVDAEEEDGPITKKKIGDSTGDVNVQLCPFLRDGFQHLEVSAQAFISHRSGWRADHEFAAVLAEEFVGNRFWIGCEQYRGVRGGHMVVVFQYHVDVHKFEILMGKQPVSWWSGNFITRFRALEVASATCQVCREDHPTLACDLLQTLSLIGKEELFALLNKQPKLYEPNL